MAIKLISMPEFSYVRSIEKEKPYTNILTKLNIRERLGGVWVYPTDSMGRSPWKVNRFSASQEIPRIIWNTVVCYHVYKCPPTVRNLSQISPVHVPLNHFLKISHNIILPFASGIFKCSLSLRFPYQNLWMFRGGNIVHMTTRFLMWKSLLFYHQYHYYPDVDSHYQLSVWKYSLSPLLH